MQPLHQPDNIIAQRYRIINILGEGGSGITYLTQDLQSDETVALKALSLQRINNWKAMELFEREAKILSQLNHPAIPRYLEYFDDDTDGDRHFYIAQQLAPGKSLAKLVENNQRTNEQQVRNIAAQILEILIYLHSLTPTVVHRDIKPQNIIRNQDGGVFLVDFGAVQDTYYSSFMHGSTVVGTYGYMAPEQFRGQAVPATDLYGLGATLLFLLTHRSPADFPTQGLKIDFRSRIHASEDFADWLEKMLEPDLEERFSSAKEALDVLHGKRKIIMGNQKPMLLKALIGMGIATAVTASIFNTYRWAILDKLGLTPLESICSNVNEIRDYLNQGGNPNLDFNKYSKVKNQKTLLLCAIEADSQLVTELLIAKGADINTALHRVKSVKLGKILIAKGAEINKKNKYEQTPLHHAVATYRKEIIELLLLNKAYVNTKDKFGDTPLHLVFQSNRKNWKKFNRLYIASEVFNNNVSKKSRIFIIKSLVENGANVNIKNNYSYTPLRLAVARQDIDSVKLLIELGADINAEDNEGNTVLDIAAKNGHKELVEQILKNNGTK